MRKMIYAIGLITFLISNKGYSQIKYSLKAEAGYLGFLSNTVNVEPGPNWKGYYLDHQNGVDFNIINGIKFRNKLFAGIGAGYLNFEGIDGWSVFLDFEYLPFKTKLSPLINVKLGNTHIWNQYEDGTQTGLGELCLGLNYRLNDKINIYTKLGWIATQQSLLIPARLGIRF